MAVQVKPKSAVVEPVKVESVPERGGEVIDALRAGTVEASDPWAVVASAPLAPVFTRARVDVEREIPATLREAFELSLREFGLIVDAEMYPNGEIIRAEIPADTAKFRQFDAGTPERADQFVKFAKMWAKNRRVAGTPNDGQVSMRAFRVKKDDKLTTVVKFAAMPLVKSEPRQPRVKVAGAADPAIIREWAKSQGLTVTERGRIPAEIVTQYNAAHAAPIVEQPATDIPPSL